MAIRVICPLTNFCCKAGSLDRCHVKQDPASVNQTSVNPQISQLAEIENIKGSRIPRICISFCQDEMLTLQVVASEWKRFDAMHLPLATGSWRGRGAAVVCSHIREMAAALVSGRSDIRQWWKREWPSRVGVPCLASIPVTNVTVLTKSVTGSGGAGDEYRWESTGEVVQSLPQWIRSGGHSRVTAGFPPSCLFP